MSWLRRVIKPAIFTACLVPVGLLVWNGLTANLGGNPIEAITWETGVWTLRFILITLAVTPLRRLTGWNSLIRLRRMLGLFAFFYGCLHFLTYVWLDQFFDFPNMVKDVMKRPFITAGFFSFLLLVPLALTSTAGMIRRLGGRRWQLLHRLVYVTAIGGVVHYWWLVKADVRRPQIYAALVAVALGVRVWVAASRTFRRVAAPAPRVARQQTSILSPEP